MWWGVVRDGQLLLKFQLYILAIPDALPEIGVGTESFLAVVTGRQPCESRS